MATQRACLKVSVTMLDPLSRKRLPSRRVPKTSCEAGDSRNQRFPLTPVVNCVSTVLPRSRFHFGSWGAARLSCGSMVDGSPLSGALLLRMGQDHRHGTHSVPERPNRTAAGKLSIWTGQAWTWSVPTDSLSPVVAGRSVNSASYFITAES